MVLPEGFCVRAGCERRGPVRDGYCERCRRGREAMGRLLDQWLKAPDPRTNNRA